MYIIPSPFSSSTPYCLLRLSEMLVDVPCPHFSQNSEPSNIPCEKFKPFIDQIFYHVIAFKKEKIPIYLLVLDVPVC
jgi:heat shock protein HspQ